MTAALSPTESRMPETPVVVLLTLAIFLMAGLVKGIVGLGLPVIALGLLTLVVTPAQAVALLVVPSFVTNIWQLAVGPHLMRLLVRLWSLLLSAFLATVAGMWSGLLTPDSRHAITALGGVLVLYGVLGLTRLRPSVSPRHERWLAPLIGIATGFISAATGVFSVPSVPYLEALGLRRDELVQALGLFFTVSTLAITIGLLHLGTFKPSIAGVSLAALVPAVAGMALGQFVRLRIHPDRFRVWFLLGLIALGAHLALRNAW
jgi:uncharacterized membrane protein YfcA